MNYEQARQVDPQADRPDAGKWRWTVRNDDRIRETGYCSPWETCPVCNGETGWLYPGRPPCDNCDSRGLVKKADPCPGHDTPEGAAEHQREYLIGNAEFVVVPDSEAHQLNRCQVEGCETFTASYMRIRGDGYRHDVVCPAHHTDGTKRALIGVPGAAMYS